MADIKVGVRLICLRTPGPEGLETAAQIGADSVQLTVGQGEYAPEGITAAGIKELQQRVQDLGMVISATDGGLDDFGDAETVAEQCRSHQTSPRPYARSWRAGAHQPHRHRSQGCQCPPTPGFFAKQWSKLGSTPRK